MATEKPVYRSEIAGAVHEMVAGFARVGVVSKTTLRQFDEACLIQADPLAPDEIRALREREGRCRSRCLRPTLTCPGISCRIGSAAGSGPADRRCGCCRLCSEVGWRRSLKSRLCAVTYSSCE